MKGTKKALIFVLVVAIIIIILIAGYFHSGTSAQTADTQAPETTEAQTEPMSAAPEETSSEEGDTQTQNLVEIFSPGKYMNPETFEITKTEDQYVILQAFNIIPETHYVDAIIEFIISDINFNGEENTTNEDVIAMIERWAEEGRILETGEPEAPVEHLDSYNGVEIADFDGTWYASDSVNIRSLPDVESDKLGLLSWGESIEATGITVDSKWVRFTYEGQDAFVSASYLQDAKPVQAPSNNGGDNTALFDDPFFDGYTQEGDNPYATFWNEDHTSMIYYMDGQWIKIDQADGPFH